MDNISKRRYVRLNTKTDEMYQDVLLFPDEATHFNQKLAADASEFRWVPYGQREGDAVAA